jgi:hypothetical protein
LPRSPGGGGHRRCWLPAIAPAGGHIQPFQLPRSVPFSRLPSCSPGSDCSMSPISAAVPCRSRGCVAAGSIRKPPSAPATSSPASRRATTCG